MPVADRSVAALGAALRRLGYTEDALDDLLGDDSHSSRPADLAVHDRRLPDSPLGTAIRLLFLARPVARADAARALGERGVEALAAAELASVGADVVPIARVIPVHDVYVAADGFSRGDDDPPDYVAGYTPTSRLCDALTPRVRVRSALDVGTGSGVHALLAARHAERVVATDVNQRALEYTRLNALLNGLDNLELRHGSLFEPAGDERFDLITCNAPFVVSPETRWAYRDTELPGDELSALVVREAAARLAAGGFATLLVSWLASDPDEPHERALAWAESSGCDAWILPVYAADPLDHAAGWNDHLADDETEFAAAVDRWVSYLDELGAGWVSEGAIVLHRRRGRVSVRVDEVEEDELEMADRQLRRAFANRAAQLRGRELLDARLALAPAARVEQVARHGKVVETRVVLDEGTQPVVEVPARLAGPIAKLDGKTRFRFEQRDARYLRELLELGMVAVRR